MVDIRVWTSSHTASEVIDVSVPVSCFISENSLSEVVSQPERSPRGQQTCSQMQWGPFLHPFNSREEAGSARLTTTQYFTAKRPLTAGQACSFLTAFSQKAPKHFIAGMTGTLFIYFYSITFRLPSSSSCPQPLHTTAEHFRGAVLQPSPTQHHGSCSLWLLLQSTVHRTIKDPI